MVKQKKTAKNGKHSKSKPVRHPIYLMTNFFHRYRFYLLTARGAYLPLRIWAHIFADLLGSEKIFKVGSRIPEVFPVHYPSYRSKNQEKFST